MNSLLTFSCVLHSYFLSAISYLPKKLMAFMWMCLYSYQNKSENFPSSCCRETFLPPKQCKETSISSFILFLHILICPTQPTTFNFYQLQGVSAGRRQQAVTLGPWFWVDTGISCPFPVSNPKSEDIGDNCLHEQ